MVVETAQCLRALALGTGRMGACTRSSDGLGCPVSVLVLDDGCGCPVPVLVLDDGLVCPVSVLVIDGAGRMGV